MAAPWLRYLYQDLRAYQGEQPYQDVLLPWMPDALQSMAELHPYSELETMAWKRNDITQDKTRLYGMWNLYALSRISDLLLLAFQARLGQSLGEAADEISVKWIGTLKRPKISLADYTEFFLQLGMQPFQQPAYQPFFHELVEVEQAEDPDEPIRLLEIRWPGFMLGHLLFSRAGVKVRGGSHHLKQHLATQTTLYFTYAREHRPTNDPSHGWGSNSQWTTEFRRDYQAGNTLYYNVDGLFDLNDAERAIDTDFETIAKELNRSERIELLTNRCFILTEKPDDDCFPYLDYYVETQP